MIHDYVNIESYTIHRNTVSTTTALALDLMTYFALPINAGILQVASFVMYIFGETTDQPDEIYVTIRSYMLKEVGTNAFVLNCHHYLIVEYEYENGEFKWRLSYMKYGVS